MNDKIELYYIEKFNNHANLDINNIQNDKLNTILYDEITNNVKDLTNENKLIFKQEHLRSLKEDIDILIKKINKSSLQKTEESKDLSLPYKS